MCIEGLRLEQEARGRPGRALVLPPGFATPSGTPATADAAAAADADSRCLRRGPAGSGLIDSVPVPVRELSDLSPRNCASDPSPAKTAADMEFAHHHHHHHANDDGSSAEPRHPADVPLNGRQPSTPEDMAVARARLIQRLVARSAAAKKAVSAAAATAAPEPDLDLLASVTAKFRVLLHRLGDALETAQRSHYYSVLSRTTQPAHLVAFVSVALVAALLFPSHTYSSTLTSRDAAATPSGPSPWTYLAYVVAFAAHFGSQFWMTFVSGLSLFFSLPRHHFAAVQKVLFPLYFAINAALSLVTLSTFVRLQPDAARSWDAEVAVQVASMVLCFLIELLVRLYLTPPLLHLITAKTEMERTVEGVGEEVGRYELGPLTQCPHYVRIHRAFRKVHTTIALANIATMACTALHAHYLAGKICV